MDDYVGLSDGCRFDRWLCVGLTSAANSTYTCPTHRSGHLDTSNIFYLWFFTMVWVSRRCWRPKLAWLGIPVWPVCIDRSDRSRWLCKNSDLTTLLRSSRRDDQNAHMEHPIWTLDERVMTPGRIDPDPDRSDRLFRAIRPVRTVQSKLGVVFWHEIN